MDKIRPVLQWLFRNRFWATCVLVSVACLATWYPAWSEIEKQRGDWANKLNRRKSSIKNVLNSEVETGIGQKSIRVHPNDRTSKEMQLRIDAAADAALAAWSVRYEAQKDQLQYARILPKKIRQTLAAHEPMEKPLEKELLNESQRDTFREEIPKHMPEIAKRLQATWQFDRFGERITELATNAGNQKNQSKRQGARLEVAHDLVTWEIKNQELWNSKTTQFSGFDGNTDWLGNRPNSQQMLALQQDLWILGGIFDVISEVNQGFTENDLAPIERIDHVLVGAEAVNNDLGSLVEYSYSPPPASGSSGKKKKGQGLVSQKQQRRENNQRRSAKSKQKGVAFDPLASPSPFHGRYVDHDFTQLNEAKITKVITSDELTEQSYLAVVKRVPVRIAIKMDERRINEFMAAAANSPFAFEIRQVRINKHEPGGGVERKVKGVTSGGDKDKKGGIGLGDLPGKGNQVDGNDKGNSRGDNAADDGPYLAERRSNFDIKIEFIGSVRIYNPVNPALFNKNEASLRDAPLNNK